MPKGIATYTQFAQLSLIHSYVIKIMKGGSSCSCTGIFIEWLIVNTLSCLHYSFAATGRDCLLEDMSCELLKPLVMEDVLVDCACKKEDAQAFMQSLSSILHSLSQNLAPGTPTYTAVLQKLWDTLMNCFICSSKALRRPTGCSLLCIGNELSWQENSGLPVEALPSKLDQLSRLYTDQHGEEITDFLGQLINLSNERQLPQLAQCLEDQRVIITSNALLEPEDQHGELRSYALKLN